MMVLIHWNFSEIEKFQSQYIPHLHGGSASLYMFYQGKTEHTKPVKNGSESINSNGHVAVFFN